MKQCPECFYTFSAPPAGVKVCCPHCGYEFPTAERKLETDSSVGLVKVEGFKLDFQVLPIVIPIPNFCSMRKVTVTNQAGHIIKQGKGGL